MPQKLLGNVSLFSETSLHPSPYLCTLISFIKPRPLTSYLDLPKALIRRKGLNILSVFSGPLVGEISESVEHEKCYQWKDRGRVQALLFFDVISERGLRILDGNSAKKGDKDFIKDSFIGPLSQGEYHRNQTQRSSVSHVILNIVFFCKTGVINRWS